MGSESLEVPLSTEDIVLGIVLPGALALVVFVVGWFRWRRNAPPVTAHWAAPVAMAIAFITGFIVLNHSVPSFPPAESSHRLFFVVPIALVLAILLNLRRLGTIPRALVVAISVAVALRYVLAFKFSSMEPALSWTWLFAAFAIAAIWWLALMRYATVAPRLAAALAVFIIAGAASLVFMLSDTLSNGRLELALLAAIGAALVAALIFNHFSFASPGGIFLFVLVTMLLIGHSHVTAGLSGVNMALLFSAPLVLWLASLIPLTKLPPWQRMVIHLLLMSVPLGVAVARAGIAFNKANNMATQSIESEL